jgi:hypothetical protein
MVQKNTSMRTDPAATFKPAQIGNINATFYTHSLLGAGG